MQFESTTLASAVSVFIEAAEKSYGFDPRPMMEDLGLDLSRIDVPGARFPEALLNSVTEELRRRTGDDCIGLTIGKYVRPTTFFALGFAWLASASLLGAFQRLSRYDRIVSTADRIELAPAEDHYALIIGRRLEGRPMDYDAFAVAIIEMCRWIADTDPAPREVHMMHSGNGREGDYVSALGAPVFFDQPACKLVFDRKLVEAPARGGNEALADMSDRMSDDYLASLDPASVSRDVRKLLIDMLPSGNSSQERIAGRLNRSCSSLQRDLRAEGTSFSELREDTRKAMAADYVRRQDISLQEVAFLLGFSDQSNFSRAFRRWTGESPKAWRAAADPNDPPRRTNS
ncbi:MAG: AraC family transcriptional regulator [Gammaproteobacteria bacterium]